MSLVDYQSSDDDDDSEKEEEVNVKPINDLKTTVPKLPKKKEPVKFTLPSLDQFDDDDEEEDGSSQSKKPKLKGVSSLLGMLPPPKFSTTSLVPNTVSRKIPPVKKVSVIDKKPPMVQKNNAQDKDKVEEESEGTVDFFSLGEDMKPPVNPLGLPPPKIEVEAIPPDTDYVPSIKINSAAKISEDLEGPLQMAASSSSTATSDYAKISSSGDTDYQIPQENADSSEDPNSFMNDEGFLRLQGKRRGKEDVNFIDISGDSLVSDIKEWHTKHLTEEKKESFSRKKHNMPSHMSRRKHQITYLAFQAKERELDLKNQWAQNRLTKQQTQSKYGF